MSDESRALARKTVDREMARQGLSNVKLATDASVDPKTVNDFLSGRRWPQREKRGAIARALGWPGDEIDRIAETGVVSVGADAGRTLEKDAEGKSTMRSLLGYPLDSEFHRQLGRLEIVLQLVPPDRLDEATTLGMQAILSTVMTPEIEALADEFGRGMDARLDARDRRELDAYRRSQAQAAVRDQHEPPAAEKEGGTEAGSADITG